MGVSMQVRSVCEASAKGATQAVRRSVKVVSICVCPPAVVSWLHADFLRTTSGWRPRVLGRGDGTRPLPERHERSELPGLAVATLFPLEIVRCWSYAKAKPEEREVKMPMHHGCKGVFARERREGRSADMGI